LDPPRGSLCGGLERLGVVGANAANPAGTVRVPIDRPGVPLEIAVDLGYHSRDRKFDLPNALFRLEGQCRFTDGVGFPDERRSKKDYGAHLANS